MVPFFKYLSLVTLVALPLLVRSHVRDTVVLVDNQIIIGEIKLLEGGIMTMKTDFSKVDFKIKWNRVLNVRTTSNFIIVLDNNLRMRGNINEDSLRRNFIIITTLDNERLAVESNDIIYLKSNEKTFWDRFAANIDGGYSFTKANNTVQYSLGGKASYISTRINPDIYFNFTGNVTQDTITSERSNYGANLKVFSKKKYFGLTTVDFLNSEEQNLKLRTTFQLGIGLFIFRHQMVALSSNAGLAFNVENFSTEGVSNDHSVESFIGVDFSIFEWKDITLSSKSTLFPSLSKIGRIRTNVLFDFNVKLPKDFYVGLYYSLNYDNQPEDAAEESIDQFTKADYVIQTKLGWKFKR